MPRRLLAIAVTALLLSGCGTVANLALFNQKEGGKRVYGGVRADWEGVTGTLPSTPTSAPDGEDRFYQVLLAMDLPVSAFWDTLTLPVTIPYAAGWVKSGPPKPAKPASALPPAAPPPPETNSSPSPLPSATARGW